MTTSPLPAGSEPMRAAEVVAVLALGTDLAVGKQMEHSLGTCVMAVELGRALGLEAETLSDVYYVSLLIMAGCTSDASAYAELTGDEMRYGRYFAMVDRARPSEMMLTLVRHAGEDRPPPQRLWTIANLLTAGMATLLASPRAHCEVARGLAAELRLARQVEDDLLCINERWNGMGGPRRLRGEAVPLSVRIAQLAFDVVACKLYVDAGAAVEMVRERAGRTYDPEIAECFRREARELFARLDTPSLWEATLGAEPEPLRMLPPEQTHAALAAIAHFTDLKSPYTIGHSQSVSDLAAAAAGECRLPPADVQLVRQAGLVHDLGRVALSSAIWDKPARLTDSEWEQVRLHPYYTERATSRSAALAPLGRLAATHHERMDGSGYHRSLPAAALPPAARILAAADAYHAMTENRPHRPALTPAQAAEELEREARAGRIDGEAAHAVLRAAGHRVRSARRQWPASLSEREVEVLRLLARGLSNREMAGELHITAKTAGHHVQHIYDKIGVSTRPAATLFAMQHDLLT